MTWSSIGCAGLRRGGERLHAGVHWSHLLSVRRMAEVASGLAPLGRGWSVAGDRASRRAEKVDRCG